MTEAEGRDPPTLTISFKAPVYDTSVTTLGGAERRPFSGTPQQIADDIGAYEKLGVQRAGLRLPQRAPHGDARADGALRADDADGALTRPSGYVRRDNTEDATCGSTARSRSCRARGRASGGRPRWASRSAGPASAWRTSTAPGPRRWPRRSRRRVASRWPSRRTPARRTGIEAMIGGTVKAFGGLDILHNNAFGQPALPDGQRRLAFTRRPRRARVDPHHRPRADRRVPGDEARHPRAARAGRRRHRQHRVDLRPVRRLRHRRLQHGQGGRGQPHAGGRHRVRLARDPGELRVPRAPSTRRCCARRCRSPGSPRRRRG